MVPVRNPRFEIGVTDSTTDAPLRGEKPVVIGLLRKDCFQPQRCVEQKAAGVPVAADLLGQQSPRRFWRNQISSELSVDLGRSFANFRPLLIR